MERSVATVSMALELAVQYKCVEVLARWSELPEVLWKLAEPESGPLSLYEIPGYAEGLGGCESVS
jgi:hypothetical protein